MHKKNKSPLDGVVRHNTLRMLFILLTLFSFHFSLLAENISSKEDNATARADKYNSIGQRQIMTILLEHGGVRKSMIKR